jgi:two-component system, NtrC family, response regulator HydG
MNAPAAPGTLRILVVDDEEIVRTSLQQWFEEDGHTVRACGEAKQALAVMREQDWDLALVDIKMPGMDGLELQKRLHEIDPELSVVVMTAFASVETAVRALKAGAYDYVTKPFDPDALSHLLRRASEQRDLLRENRGLKAQLEEIVQPSPILGHSLAIGKVVQLVGTVAPTNTSVMITGESGVGKELVARAIHANSPRAYMPLVVVNCGALSEGILESELFGHERGAFTGAQYRHKGKFELADGGTLFLDEIGEVTPKIQVELLRVLEEKQLVRLGGTQTIRADFRLVAATNKDLRAAVAAGSFREDLYYRLNVFEIHVPPLRERREDIRDLVLHFAQRFARQMNRPLPSFTAEALRALEAHDWPGNVRELSNAIERAMVVQRGDLIDTEHLPLRTGSPTVSATVPTGGDRSLATLERRHIESILDETGWNISETARLLGVDRGTVYNKIKLYGLKRMDGIGSFGAGEDR